MRFGSSFCGVPDVPHFMFWPKGQRIMYGRWDYVKSNDPHSIPHMVSVIGKSLEKSAYSIQQVVFGSRRWAEYTSLYDCPYEIVYDSQVERGLILFFDEEALRGRLKISNLPAERKVPEYQ